MLHRRTVVASILVVVISACTVDLVLSPAVGCCLSRRGSSSAVPPIAETLLLSCIALAAILAAVRFRETGARTSRRLDEAREEAERLLKVIDNTSAVIYLRDSSGRYLLVNRQYEELFAIRRKDIVGLTDHDLFPPAMADDFRANDLKALAHGSPIQMEEIAPHADGPHTYITIKYPIADATGRAYAICGISTDITELKRAEERARQLNTELEQRVRDRTAELEASTRELDSFAYSVSHDLRAPLRAVAGFSEVLLEDYADRLDKDGQEYLNRVLAATDRMGGLIDDLLDLSRAARVELARSPVDLSRLSEHVVAELRAAEPDREGGVEIRVEPELKAFGDPALLRLVLQNLIGNAWKFTAKKPDARIEIGSAERDGEQVFFVRDNGAGFDMRYVDKLFVPFQRVHSFHEFAGSGIGLAIVWRIIARHGGRVWAQGEPGLGAAFHFTLPARADAGEASREAV
ncbi:MAG TPA: ATP-binding protein [Actinocrinis sp.]|nr:ATP-binding protein [Actinocrinis sp.]